MIGPEQRAVGSPDTALIGSRPFTDVDPGLQAMLVRMADGLSGSATHDWEGWRRLAAFALVAGTQLTVAISADPDEVTGSLVDALQLQAAAATFFGLVVGLAEVRDQLFAAYATTMPVGEGTGLGLYLCRAMLESAGGWIRVDSTWTAGAAFEVWLPQSQPSVARASWAASVRADLAGQADLIRGARERVQVAVADQAAGLERARPRHFDGVFA